MNPLLLLLMMGGKTYNGPEYLRPRDPWADHPWRRLLMLLFIALVFFSIIGSLVYAIDKAQREEAEACALRGGNIMVVNKVHTCVKELTRA